MSVKPDYPSHWHEEAGVWYCDAHGTYQCRRCGEFDEGRQAECELWLKRLREWRDTLRGAGPLGPSLAGRFIADELERRFPELVEGGERG